LAKWQSCTNSITSSGSTALSNITILFPNPSTGKFTIVGTQNFVSTKIDIYNMLGERVFSQFNFHNPTFKVDLSARPNGIYLYRVIRETGELVGEGKVEIEK